MTVDPDLISSAWEHAQAKDDSYTRELLDPEKRDYGKQAITNHVPYQLPHGPFCRTCGHRYPCWVAIWGLGLLKGQGWEVSDVVEFLEAIAAGGQP